MHCVSYILLTIVFSLFLYLGESFATTRASIAPTTSQGNRGIQFVQIYTMLWPSPLMQMSLKSFCLDDSMERALKFKYSLRTQTYRRLSLLSIHPKNNYKNKKFIFLVERSGDRKYVCVRRLIQMMLTSQVSLHIL